MLDLDHINNDGAIERRRKNSSLNYSRLVNLGFPPGFQVLCRNCNWRKHRHHQRAQRRSKVIATPAQLIAGLGGYMSHKAALTIGFLDLTITDAKIESVGQGDKAEDVPVLTFKETRKKLVLNKTRANQLAEVIGETTDPIGQRLRVGPGQAEVNGRVFDMVVIETCEE